MFTRKIALFFILSLGGCCENPQDLPDFGLAIQKNGLNTLGKDKEKINVFLIDDTKSKQSFNLLTLNEDTKDSIVSLSINPPLNKSLVKYLIVNNILKRTDTLSLSYSVSKCSITLEEALLNGKKGKMSEYGGVTIFEINK